MQLYVGIVNHPYTSSSTSLTTQICASLRATKQFFSLYEPTIIGSSLLSHARASTFLSCFMNSNQRSMPLDSALELGMASPERKITWKESTDAKAADWSSNRPTMVSSLKIDEERSMTPSSIRMIWPDGNHTIRLVESKDELVLTPSGPQFDHHDDSD